MSILIKDMKKPKFCYPIIDGEYEYCPFVNTDDDCVLQLEKGICEGTWEDQYSKCPLVEAPEPCEDAVSRKTAIDAVIKDSQVDGAYGYMDTKSIVDLLDALPSVQSEITHCKDTNTCGKRNDTISRKAAIERFCELLNTTDKNPVTCIREVLDYLPSVSSEVIHCQDCKNWIPGYVTDQDDFIPPKCGKYQQMVGHSCDDFCSLAERDSRHE